MLLLFLLFNFIVTQVICVTSPTNPLNPDESIEKASVYDFRYHVQLKISPITNQSNFVRYCAGALYTLQWVLTVAHCFNDFDLANSSSTVVAIFNTVTVDSIIKKLEMKIINNEINIILNPNYRANTFQNDIALIKLPQSTIDLSLTPQAIVIMPSTMYCMGGNYSFTFAGNGAGLYNESTFTETPVIELRKVKYFLLDQKSCLEAGCVLASYFQCSGYADGFSPSHFCGRPKIEAVAALGDDGAGLIAYDGATPTPYLYGLFIRNTQEVNAWSSNNLAFFISVTDYIPWIEFVTLYYGQP